MFLQYFVVYFFNHFACFEAFQWTFHPYGFRGDGWGGRYFPGVGRMNWGERILCRNGGLWRIEEGVLMHFAQCWILESSSYFWSAGSLSGLQEAYTSLHGWDLLVIVGRGENCYKVNFGQSSFGPIWVFSEDGAFWSVSVLFRCLSIAYGGVKVWGVPSSFGCWGLEQGWGFGLLVIGRRRFCYFQQCNWGQICSNIWVEDIRQ